MFVRNQGIYQRVVRGYFCIQIMSAFFDNAIYWLSVFYSAGLAVNGLGRWIREEARKKSGHSYY